MKIKRFILLGVTLLALAGTMPAATNDISTLLQRGLLEEEANHNLDAAIRAYQAIVTQTDKDHQFAATAIFHLAECFRKLGRTNEATAQYQRLLRDFSDQTELVGLSRQNLTGTGVPFQQRLATIVNRIAQDSDLPTEASEDQEIQRIRQMVQNSPDLINASEKGFGTPLHHAAAAGQVRMAQYLLDHNANVNAAERGKTPLTMAAANGHKAMVELLLSHGAAINPRDAFGDSALHEAARHGFQAVAEVLLASHADVNALNDRKEAPLHLAAQGGHLAVVRLLLAAGANPNLESQSGWTPMSSAVEARSWEIVKALLDAKADPNGGRVDLPLFLAVRHEDAATAELLLARGANPNAIGPVDWTLDRHRAGDGRGGEDAYFTNHRDRMTPLWLAVYTKQLAMVQLLLRFQADPNDSRTDGKPLLFSALDDSAILAAMLEKSGKADVRDGTAEYQEGFGMNRTLLDAAANRNLAVAVELLLIHGADITARDAKGNTALHWAAENQLPSRKVFELLLDHNADPNARNNDGKTALMLINSLPGGPETAAIAGLLRQRGALDNLPNWDRIDVSRPSAKFSLPVFRKDTNDWNHFSLLETILNCYGSGQMYPFPQRNNSPPGSRGNVMESADSLLQFPDLTRLVIVRPAIDSTNVTRMVANVLNSTNGVDVAKDVPLEFGDVVEIPERDHSLGERPVGLTASQLAAINNHLKGSAQLVVRDQKVELPLYQIGNNSMLGSLLRQPDAQRLLLSSSDLSRLKVSRRDPKTSQTREWILDCSKLLTLSGPIPGAGIGTITPPPLPELRIRNGDLIEVPEKP